MSLHHLSHNERKQYEKLLRVTRQQAHLPLTLPRREGRDGIRHTDLVWATPKAFAAPAAVKENLGGHFPLYRRDRRMRLGDNPPDTCDCPVQSKARGPRSRYAPQA